MSSHEGVPKNGSQQPRTTLAGLQLGLGGRPTSGNGSAPHLPPPQATTSGIVQPAPVRIQPGSFDAQLLSAQLAQAAANVAASTPSAFPAGPSTEHPQHSPQTPRVTPPVSAAFSAFGAAGPSQAGPSAAAMATQQLMQNYQQLLLSIMQQQQQQAQPRVPQYTSPQLDIRQMLMMQQQNQLQQQLQQQQLQQLAALQQQQQQHQLQQQQAAAAAALAAQQQQQQPVVTRPPPDPSTLTLQQQRNVADSTAMPPPPLPRRPIPSTISLPPPQPSTSQPRRTSPQHPQSLPSTSHQPQPHHIPPMPPMPRAALETIPELGTINMKPYYPTHFMRGTRIQLETGAVKNVEEMTQMDFHMSGAAAEGLDVELSKVIAIEKASEGSVQTAKVTLVAGDTKVRVTIQVFVEHPFFVIGYGWCSVNPTLTKARFGLDCQVLAVGHAAISLVKKEDKKRVQEHLNGASRRAAAAAAEGSSSTTGPRRPSLPSTVSSSGNGTGSTSPASTSSVISRHGSTEGSGITRSDLRSRIKTYQRQSPPPAPSLSQRSIVIRRPRRHRSVPPADPVELRRRTFDRKERRGERTRRASISCVKDSHGAFSRV